MSHDADAQRRSLEEAILRPCNRPSNTYGRRDALLDFASRWSDDATRDLLEDRAVNDPQWIVRGEALALLTSSWPDLRTRDLLERCYRDDPVGENEDSDWDYDDGFQRRLLALLLDNWPDERTRSYLESANDDTRFEFLAKTWPDARTRNVIETSVASPAWCSLSSLFAILIKHWPDESTRTLISEIVETHPEGKFREEACDALVARWPDAESFDFIHSRAVADTSFLRRIHFLHAIQRHWPIERWLPIYRDRAENDPNQYVKGFVQRRLDTVREQRRNAGRP